MTVEINPKLLDVIQFAGSPFKAEETRYGTIVEILGGSPEEALIEVSDEQGIPLDFVRRAVGELRVSNRLDSVQHDSKVPEAQRYFENGILFLQNGWHEQAKEQFFKSFELDPKFRGTLLNTTNELATKGAFGPAIVVYTMLLELSPDYELARENFAVTQMNRAIAFAQRRLFPQAMEAFLKALALQPSPATAQRIRDNIVATYTKLGLLYSSANQYQLAFECFQKAFELDQSEISRKNLGVALIAVSTAGSRGWGADARANIFREPILMGLTLSECLTAFGATLAALGEIDFARRAFESAIEADPLNSVAKHNLQVVSSPESNEGVQAGLVSIDNQPFGAVHF